ncbi:MAG: aerobic carbon-monoxide dehydrogenase medium subunit [Alphaproteobacteria bacterium]|jgi:carbon-monoxide dehydrogenase medium subunit|nr:aerobic carbon-monoxide dehydrogenase medium subunit [Alphaproteobacteria bacterium]
MKPAPFQYHAPTTVAETLDLLAQHAKDDGRVLAGGQSLVPTMAFRLARPKHLVDINGVAALNRLVVENGKLCIGAAVRHAAFEKPVEDGPLGRLLASVVRHIAHHPIRTRGTFCGSIAHADPASEWCTVAVALDADMVAESKTSGMRVIPARSFFEGIMTTALHEEELLREVRLPILPKGTHVGFAEYSRRAGDYAVAMAVTTYRLKNGVMSDMHIAVGGAEATPRRIPEAERTLIGRSPNLGTFQSAAHEARKAVDPLDDPSISADYRRDIVRAMVSRALENATP